MGVISRLEVLLKENEDIAGINEIQDIREIGDLVPFKEFSFTNIEYLLNTLKDSQELIEDGEIRDGLKLIQKIRKSLMLNLMDLEID